MANHGRLQPVLYLPRKLHTPREAMYFEQMELLTYMDG